MQPPNHWTMVHGRWWLSLRLALRLACWALGRPAVWLGVALLLGAGGAVAVPLPESGRVVNLEARDQPLDQFLQDLFAATDIPVVVNSAANGLVNGRFNGTATRVLRDISRAYNLTSYYDGAALHVGPASDMLSRSYVLPAAMAQQVVATAKELQLTDPRNTLRSSSDGALVAVGARRYLQQMDELVRQVRPTSAQVASAQPLMDYRVFYLRYAWAQDLTANFAGRQTVLPGVVSILRSLVGQSSQPGGGMAADRTSAQRLRGQGLASQAGASARLPTLGQDGGEPKGVEALVTALNQVADGGAAPQGFSAALTAESLVAPRIEADARLNAVIVRDLPERLPRYAELIKSLDVEPQSLEIEATIIDINTDRLQELGVNWRLNHGLSSLMFGNGTASDLRLNGTQDPTPSYRGGALSAVLGDKWQFVARISALEAEGAAKVVSSPQVVTLSNVEAVFDSSSTFYVRVAGRDDVDLFNVTAGTSLRVTPHAFRDNDSSRIKLMVQIEDGTLSAQTVDTLPVVRRSGINTQALITEGESLLVGGMTRDSSNIGEDKIPLLGDLPVIGHLFKTRTSGRERVERLFLITPRLATARSTAAAAQKALAPLQPVPAQAPAPAPASAPELSPAAPPATPPADGPKEVAPT